MSETQPDYISAQAVARVADVAALATEMRQGYADPRAPRVPRRSLVVRDDPFAAFVAMPAYSDAQGLFITKIGTVVPKQTRDASSVHALVAVFSARHGHPLAIIDGIALTNLKCAAVTALVTDRCASAAAKILGIVGSGVQAREQLRGVRCVRELSEVRVYSRNPDNVQAFVCENAALARGAKLVACRSAEQAIEGADIVSTATTSTAPVVSSEPFRNADIHVNCMGAHTVASRELPADLMRDSMLVVEDVEMAVAEAGPLHRDAIPIAALDQHDIATLRTKRTVFSSTGHAYLDLLACAHVLRRLSKTDAHAPPSRHLSR